MPNADNIVMSAKKLKVYKYDEAEELTLPTVSELTVTWGDGWEDAPYVTEEGVTIDFSREKTETKAFMYPDPVKVHYENTVTVSLTFLESGSDVLDLVFPSLVVGDDGWIYEGDPDSATDYAIGIETDTEVWVFPRVRAQGNSQFAFRDAEHNTVAAEFIALHEWELADDNETLVATGKTWYRTPLEEATAP